MLSGPKTLLESAMETVNFVVHPSVIITVNSHSEVLRETSIVVRDGKIESLLPTAEARSLEGIAQVDLSDHILMPGLINAHGHAAMTLLRGIADDMALTQWLNDKIWPLENKWVDQAFVMDGTEIAAAEMIMSGVTTASDQYFFPDIAAQTFQQAGLRAQLTFPIIDVETAWGRNGADYLEKGLALRDTYRDHDLVTVGFGPHSNYAVDEALLAKTATLAAELDAPVQIHLHETAHEVLSSVERIGERPIDQLARLGLLSPKTQCVHMTALGNQDIDTIAAYGAHVVHCPKSNMKLASGLCPVTKLLDRGINVALGTDGAASNNRLNALSEMQAAALLAKIESGSPDALPAHQAIELATINGAKALGIDHITGSIEVGKAADMIALDTSELAMAPGHNVVSDVVYATAGNEVRWSWVAGHNILRDRRLQTMDIEVISRKAAAWRVKLAAA